MPSPFNQTYLTFQQSTSIYKQEHWVEGFFFSYPLVCGEILHVNTALRVTLYYGEETMVSLRKPFFSQKFQFKWIFLMQVFNRRH